MDLMHLGFLKIFTELFLFYGDEWQLTKEKKLCPENLIHTKYGFGEATPRPTATTDPAPILTLSFLGGSGKF